MIPPDFLRHVPGCETGLPPIEVVSLQSGTAHLLWRVRTSVGEFVVRAPDPALPGMDGRDFRRELVLQRAAAAADLAPQVYYEDPLRQLIVMDFVCGTGWLEGDFGLPARLRGLLARLQMLHDLPVPRLQPLDPLANARLYGRQLLSARSADRLLIEQRLAAAAQAWQVCLADGRTPSIIHCDLHAGNIVQRTASGDGTSIVFLDWEYAQVGDPLLDYASLCAQYPQAQSVTGDFLSHGGADLRRLAPRLAAGSAVFAVLSWLWWCARASQQAPSAADLHHAAVAESRIELYLGPFLC